MNRVLPVAVVVFTLLSSAAQGQTRSVAVPLDADHWNLDTGAQIVPFGGRTALTGTGYVKGVSFLNGTIETDAWLTDAPDFAGFLFHVQSLEDNEFFWLRTFKTNGVVSDAIQYAPAFHSVFCWQLRPDAIGPVNVPKNQWVHMKLEIRDDSAALYVGDMAKPALKVAHLGRGLEPGSAGLKMLGTGRVYFSNFSYLVDDSSPAVQKPRAIAPNIMAGWQLSPPYAIPTVDAVPTAYPARQLAEIGSWIAPEVEASGLINISRYHGTKYHSRPTAAGGRPDYAILKTFVDADADKRVKMNFGYSDAVTIFLNGRPLFSGNSAFMSRNIADGEWISYNDAVFLDLKKGRNELLAVVAEDFGGWAFQAKLDDMNGIRVSSGRE